MERYFYLDKFNTWLDWRLILTAKDVTPPEPKTNYVNLDGMSGTLDLSQALTGETHYADRTVSASFWTNEGTFRERALLIKKIITTLHGKKIKIIEPDDPLHYFYGRVSIKSINNILPYMTFRIEAVCEPWRYTVQDIVRKVEVNGKASVVINNNGVKTIIPIIEVNGSVDLTYEEKTISLTDGSYKAADIKLYQGANVIDVSGNGSVTFTYKEADL